MAASDKDIVISPQRGSTTNDPGIVFTGNGNDPISIFALDNTTGSLSFEGSAGQLFSITNNLTSGSIFSVNDVSGIPSIDVNADGTVSIVAYGGYVGIGTDNPTFGQSTPISTYDPKLGIQGSILIGNLSTTASDRYELQFYRRNGAAGQPIDTHDMGRIAWYGSSNDGDNANLAWSIGVNPDGGGWTSGVNRKGYMTFNNHNGEQIRITSGGNVGIGTTNPSTILELRTASDTQLTLSSSNNTADGRVVFKAASGTEIAGIYMQQNGDTRFYTGGMSNERLVIKNGGNVGIGTDDPALRAHIYSTAATDAALIESTQNFATLRFKSALNSSGPTIGIDGAGGLQLDQKDTSKYISFAIGSERLRISSDGKLSVTGSTANMEYLRMGGNNDRGLRFTSSSGTSSVGVVHTINAPGDNGNQGAIVLETNSTERVRITSDGDIGVGSNNPQSKLQIENAGEQLRLTYPSIASYIHEVKSNGDYAIDRDGSERLRITSSGNVGIGTDNPLNKLHLNGESYFYHSSGNSATYEFVGNHYSHIKITGDVDASAGGPYYNYVVTNGGDGTLEFRNNTTANLKVTYNGVVQIGGDVGDAANDIDTSNTKLTIKQSGMGLEDGIYIERPNERRGYYARVANSGSAQDALVFGMNHLGTDTDHLLSLDRDGNVTMTAGNVGIGTDNPEAKVHIRGGANSQFIFETTTTANAAQGGPVISLGDSTSEVGVGGGIAFVENLTTSGNNTSVTMGMYYNGISNYFAITGSASSGSTVGANLRAATHHFVVQRDAGNVGIGTDNPSAKLDVRGTLGISNTTDTSVRTKLTSSSSGFIINHIDNSNTIFQNQGNERFLIADGGSVVVTSNGSDNNGANITLKHDNNNTTDVVSSLIFSNNVGEVARISGRTDGGNTNGGITFHTDNAGTTGERVRITSSGNVGIGTDDPSAKIHVSGGDLYVNSLDNTEVDIKLGINATDSNFGIIKNVRSSNSQNYLSFNIHNGSLYEALRLHYGEGLYVKGNGSYNTTAYTGNVAHVLFGDQQISFADIVAESESASSALGALVFKTKGTGFISFPQERLRITSDGKVRVPDNGKFTAGASDDLQIYHDGSNSFMLNSTGELQISSGGSTLFIQAVTNENAVKLIPNAAVELYYDGSKKFETTSTGINVTGSATATTFESTQATGIAPFTVASTTLVSNLNADLLDGQQGSYYLNTSSTAQTKTGNLTISKTSPKLILSDTNITTGSYPAIQFDTNNDQGVLLEHNEFDGELPVSSGYGLILKESPNNSQFPSTGTLTFTVLGEIYTGSATTSATSRVLTTADEGSGNGLDADTVDGLDSTQFLRSDADDTATGQILINNNQANPLELQRSSQVGIEFNDTSVGSRYLGVNGGVLRYGSNLNHGNNSKIWHEGNHGDGSGLDADKLDGQHGSYYLNTGTNFGGDVSGTYNAIVVANDSHNHAFNNLTGKTSGTGEYSTSGNLESGRGSGGVALTINDGYGNANVTFNHKSGTPEQNGKAGRIEVDTDSTTGDADMFFELGSATAGVTASLTSILKLSDGTSEFYSNAGLIFYNRPGFNGGTSGSSSPFTVDSTQVVTNLNADLLDGYHGSFSNVGSTVPIRDSSGDISCRLIRQEYQNQSSISGGMVFRVNNSTDNYLRVCNSPAAIRTFLDTNNASNLSSGTIPDARIPDTITPATLVTTKEVRTSTGQELILNAGEAAGKFSGQTNEYVYVNAESGLLVSTPDSAHTNFQSGYSQDQSYIRGRSIGIKANPGNNLAGRNACLAIGDIDTGLAQNGDGNLELWSNNQVIVECNTSEFDVKKTLKVNENTVFHAGNIPQPGGWFSGTAPLVRSSDGVMEIGRYIDFHSSNTTTADYNARLDCSTNGLLALQGSFQISSQLNLVGGSDGARYFDVQNGNSGVFYIRSVVGGDTGHQNMITAQRSGPIQLYHGATVAFKTGNDSTYGRGVDITGGLLHLTNPVTASGTPSANVRITTGGYIQKISSTRASKTNIEEITDERAINFLQNARPITYNDIKEPEGHIKSYGFIAEEMDEVDPMLTEYDADDIPDSVQYGCIPTVLTKIVQLQNARIEDLEARLAALESGT